MPPLSASGLARDAARKDFDEQAPRCAFVERRLSLPMEGLRRNLGEAPARQCARFCRALLNDVRALPASHLLPVGVICRVDPVDVPGIEGGVVNPNCRPVPVAGNRHGWRVRAAFLAARNHPDILDRTTLEHPSEVDLALTLMTDSVWRVGDNIRVPVANELSI